jgi:hypothetical protein
MHTYRKSKHEELWTVGYWSPEVGEPMWEPLKDFTNERKAAEYVNYLNGGNKDVNCYTMEP